MKYEEGDHQMEWFRVIEHIEDVEPLFPGLTDLYLRFYKRSTAFFGGSNRVTFIMGRYVVKLPQNYDGIADNDWEGSVRHSPDLGAAKYARTRLIYVGQIPVLVMEYVEPWCYRDLQEKLGKVPTWVDFIDCQQVGYNRRGQLVAYDYGIR